MGYKYTGDSVLGLSLTIDTPKPLDSRTVVDNLQQLYDIPAATAYQGMTVANIANGNIYMLVDKNKINEKAGWKASYESIQIVACEEKEYNLWLENTNEDFTPKNDELTYLHPDTYYYIYEDSIENKGGYYVSAEEFEKLQNQVNTKASNSGLETLTENLGNFKTTVAETYLTTKSAELIYATKEELSTSLSESLKSYYTINETDEKFVTKDSLRGGIEGGDDDFVFVTQAAYAKDKSDILDELSKTIKTDGDGQLETITVNTITTSEIKSPVVEGEDQLSVQITKEGLLLGEDLLAKQSEIPKFEPITLENYNDKLEKGTLDTDTYYFVYDTEADQTYVTKAYIDNEFTRTITTSILDLVAGKYEDSDAIKQLLSQLQPKGEYVTSEEIKSYYTKEETNAYTQEELEKLSNSIADTYVTIDTLTGDGSDASGYIFVTQTELNEYKEEIETYKETVADEFKNTLKVEEDGSIKTLTVETLKSSQNDLVIQVEEKLNVQAKELQLNSERVALKSEVPVIMYMSQSDYEKLEPKLDNVYYYTYSDDPNEGFITKSKLDDYCTLRHLEDVIAELNSKIAALEAKLNIEE